MTSTKLSVLKNTILLLKNTNNMSLQNQLKYNYYFHWTHQYQHWDDWSKYFNMKKKCMNLSASIVKWCRSIATKNMTKNTMLIIWSIEKMFMYKHFLSVTTCFIILLYMCLNSITMMINSDSKLKSELIIFQKSVKKTWLMQ